MKQVLLTVALAVLVPMPAFTQAGTRQTAPSSPKTAAHYFPDRFDWQTRAPDRAGFDAAKLDAARVDMTFSVTKSFLSTVVGLAWQKGLIRDVNDRVKEYVPLTDLFDSEHNAPITWDHLLRQTSDWQGTLWGSRTGRIARRGSAPPTGPTVR